MAPREQDGLEISDPLSGRAEPLDRSTARTAGAGVTAYTPPVNAGDPGTFVNVTVYLQCVEYMKRSKQQ